MDLFKKIVFMIVLSTFIPLSCSSALSQKNLTFTSAVLMDGDTGTIIYEKNKDKKMYPASLTKVITAILVLEKLDLNQTVTVTKDVYGTYGSRLYLEVGEEISVKDLMYGLLLRSANDAAVMLAVAHSGSIDKFAEQMNKKAVEIGALNTNFSNPNGLHNKDHYSTAYDMALISRYAMKNETFRLIVKSPRYSIEATNKQPDSRLLINSNDLLEGAGNYNINYKGKNVPIQDPAVTGIKTGYTPEAGTCLISSMTKNGRDVVSVVMNSKGKSCFIDSKYLLDYGTGETSVFDLYAKNSLVGRLDAADGKEMALYTKDGIKAYVSPGTDEGSIKEKIVKAGSSNKVAVSDKVVAYLEISVKNKIISRAPLFQRGAISSSGSLSTETTSLKDEFKPTTQNLIKYSILLSLTFLLWRTIMTIFKIVRLKIKKMIDMLAS